MAKAEGTELQDYARNDCSKICSFNRHKQREFFLARHNSNKPSCVWKVIDEKE